MQSSEPLCILAHLQECVRLQVKRIFLHDNDNSSVKIHCVKGEDDCSHVNIMKLSSHLKKMMKILVVASV